MIVRRLVSAAIAICLAMVFVKGTGLSAQRGGAFPSRTSKPSGTEIAAAARAARLDTGNVGTATMFGKPFKFIPAQLPTKNDPPGDGKGLFLGVLENGAVGDETGLPPGKYNLYYANVNGQPTGYAEANGQFVREAIRTTSTPAAAGTKVKPEFHEKGWWVAVYTCQGVVNTLGEWSVQCYRKRLYF